MASPTVFSANFNGMWQDAPRDRLPKGKAWNLVNFIPGVLGAPLQLRGAWSYGSVSITSVSETDLGGIAYAPFTAGNQLLLLSADSGSVYSAASATGSLTNHGSIGGTPTWFQGQVPGLLNQKQMFPASSRSAQPYYYTGSGSVSSITAAPTGVIYETVYAGRVAAAGSTAQPQRVYFSAIDDVTSWDTTNAWINAADTVTGLAALPNVLLVFTRNHTARIRGSNPPPQTDMSLDEPLFQYGVPANCAGSIAVNGSFCAFANPQGVFLTNGTASPTDLTAACGIKQLWQNIWATNTVAFTPVGGWFKNLYVLGNMGNLFVFDVQRSSVYRFSNMTALGFAVADDPVVGQELYWCNGGLGRQAAALRFSSVFPTDFSAKVDPGNNISIQGSLETPFYESASLASQRWKDAYIEYDLRDGGAAPTFTIGYVTSPEATSYTAASPTYTNLSYTLPATTAKTLARRPLRVHSNGIALKIAQLDGNACTDARIYKVGATVYNREGSRLDATV